MPTEPATSAALAALIQAIAAREIDRPSSSVLHREALEESYFQAARHGLEAEVLFASERLEPVREAAARVLEAARPYAHELDAAEPLAELERILREGNGADEQHRLARGAGLGGLLARLVERSR